MLQIKIQNGDATRVSADALVTLINSQKQWFGGVDRAIMRNAGERFHRQAAMAIDARKLSDGTAIYASDESIDPAQRQPFKAVIFVIDDLKQSLGTLVINALDCAVAHQAHTLTLPALRMGMAAGIYEKTPLETVTALHSGITEFEHAHPAVSLTLTFVIYDDRATVDLLTRYLLPPNRA